MSTINEKMTALANEVRELSGETGALSIDGMTTTLGEENAGFHINLQTQNGLIEQIQSALQGKAGGGSSAPDGEDVTAETNAYTEKITQLTEAIIDLENELDGKASGSGSIQTYTGTVCGAGALGEMPDTLYLYTDETLATRAEAVPSRTNTTITIAAGTNVVAALADGFASMSESERLEQLRANGIQHVFVFVPTRNNFELYF